METNDLIWLIYAAIGTFLAGQVEASGNIGNRAYSVWYETHLLLERKGLCRLIYFKPKHFGRYTLYEAANFFTSCLCIPLYAILGLLFAAERISATVFGLVLYAPFALWLSSLLAILLLNDIGSHRDQRKKFYAENGQRELQPFPEEFEATKLTQKEQNLWNIVKHTHDLRNTPHYNLYHLKDSYHAELKCARNDPAKVDQVQLKYIAFFKTMERLVVVKEQKNGVLILNMKETLK